MRFVNVILVAGLVSACATESSEKDRLPLGAQDGSETGGQAGAGGSGANGARGGGGAADDSGPGSLCKLTTCTSCPSWESAVTSSVTECRPSTMGLGVSGDTLERCGDYYALAHWGAIDSVS